MKLQAKLNVPAEAATNAQEGLRLLKSAMLQLIEANPDGVKNAESARALGIQSEYLGAAQDYLSYSILGLLMKEGKVKRGDDKRHQII